MSASATAQEHDAAHEEDGVDEQQQQHRPVQVDPIGGGIWRGEAQELLKDLKTNLRCYGTYRYSLIATKINKETH